MTRKSRVLVFNRKAQKRFGWRSKMENDALKDQETSCLSPSFLRARAKRHIDPGNYLYGGALNVRGLVLPVADSFDRCFCQEGVS